ncbi:MAG: PAS domain S-box protein, partial [Acidimicrobiales bacterium]
MAFSGISDVAQLLPDAIVVIDDAGGLKWANAAAERLLGLRADEVLGGSTLDFVHPEDAQVVLSALSSIQAKQVGTPIEIRLRALDGWKLVEVVGTNLLAHPNVAGVVLCLRDLTQRRRWEVARDEVSRFRALVHNAATVMMLVDGRGTVESVSAAITRLLGHDQELVEGRPLSDFVAEDDRERLGAVLAQAVAARPGDPRRTTIEVHLLHRTTSDAVPYELHIVNLLDDPTVSGLVVSGHDVTELRNSHERLAEVQAELLRRARLAAIGELASVVGHELRNPLGAATNFLYLARQTVVGKEEPELEEYLTMVERQIGRATALSEDLTYYVREHEPEPEPLDLSTVVGEVLDATSPPTGVDVEVAVPSLTLDADATQLNQMITNLVTNAYQAMSSGGTLRIDAHSNGDSIELNVTDSGDGIHPDAAPRLFDPFFTTKA